MYKDIYLKNAYEEIVKLIDEKARVLDLGCGNGDLLKILTDRKNVYGLGIDISTNEILECIKRGVSVIQEDIDEGLEKIKDNSYDYVILSETLQAVKRPDYVLKQMVRIGNMGIVSFPNFAHIKNRLEIFFKGRMPKSKMLPFEWYNTPNIHLLTIKDFRNFCAGNGISVLKEAFFTSDGSKKRYFPWFENLLAEEALFVIKKTSETQKT